MLVTVGGARPSRAALEGGIRDVGSWSGSISPCLMRVVIFIAWRWEYEREGEGKGGRERVEKVTDERWSGARQQLSCQTRGRRGRERDSNHCKLVSIQTAISVHVCQHPYLSRG